MRKHERCGFVQLTNTNGELHMSRCHSKKHGDDVPHDMTGEEADREETAGDQRRPR